MRRFLLAIVAVVAVVGLAGAALGQVSPEWVRCVNESGTYSSEIAIAACSAVIDSGKVSQAALAVAYFNRGQSYDSKGDKDRAIADYSKAIDLNPGDANYYNNRGVAYRGKGDIDRA